MCSWERLTQHKPFKKCALLLFCYHNNTNNFIKKNETYEILFTAVRLGNSSSQTTVNLWHYLNSSILSVECYKFLSTYWNQTRVFHQNLFDWHSVEITAYCLTNSKVDVSSYIQGCIRFALRKVCELQCSVVFFFQLTQLYTHVSRFLSICKSWANLSRPRSFNNVWRCIQPSVSWGSSGNFLKMKV